MESQATIPGQFGKNFFNIEMTTMNFVLLNIATLNVFFFFWMYNMCNSINKYYKGIKISIVLVVCMIAFSVWSDVLIDMDEVVRSRDFALKVFALLIFSVSPALAIGISFKSRSYIQNMLAEHGLPAQLNGFLCFIFAGFYQYYCIRNAEMRYRDSSAPIAAQQSYPGGSKLDKIEKLASLKDSGAISEEEFLVEKQKILSE